MEIVYILVGLNCMSFLLMAFDKYQAINRRWRVSEQTFLVVACLGGWLGIFAAMRFIHHKNRKVSFFYKILFGVFVSLVGIYALIGEGIVTGL